MMRLKEMNPHIKITTQEAYSQNNQFIRNLVTLVLTFEYAIPSHTES